MYDSLIIKPIYAIAEYSYKKEDLGKVICFYFNLERPFESSHFIVFKFDSCPQYNTLHPLLFPGIGKLIDMNAVINLYKPLIVKDVIVKDYQQDEPANPAVMLQKE